MTLAFAKYIKKNILQWQDFTKIYSSRLMLVVSNPQVFEKAFKKCKNYVNTADVFGTNCFTVRSAFIGTSINIKKTK